MTDLTHTARPAASPIRQSLRKVPGWAWQFGIAAVVYAVISHLILSANPGADIRFRIDFSRLALASLTLKVHVAGALTAFFVGLYLLIGPKGRGLHKPLGWTWVVAMAVTAVSSFFLTGLNGSSFSWIHGLSAYTMIGLPFGIVAIRRRKVKQHAKHMTGMFIGGMAIAGLFTFLPGRLMWSLFFGA